MVRTKRLGISAISTKNYPELLEASRSLLLAISSVANKEAEKANAPLRHFYNMILLKTISILIDSSHDAFNKAAIMKAMMKE